MLNLKRISICMMFVIFSAFSVSTMTSAETPTYNDMHLQAAVSEHHDFVITFSSEVDEMTIDNEYIAVKTSDMKKVQGVSLVISADKKTVTVMAPQEGYAEGETYFLFIEQQIKSKSGKKLSKSTKFQFKTNENEPTDILERFITLPQHTYDAVEVEKMITRISRIPEPYLKGLVKNGVELRLINTLLTDQPEYEYLKGVTPRGWEGTGKTWDDVPGIGGNPIIVRIGQSDFNSGHGTLNLELHESAHVIDSYLFNGVSNSTEFQDIMQKELDNLIEDHPNQYNKAYFTYPEEYFAEAFVYFYLNDARHVELQEKAPLTYQFMLKLEEEYMN